MSNRVENMHRPLEMLKRIKQAKANVIYEFNTRGKSNFHNFIFMILYHRCNGPWYCIVITFLKTLLKKRNPEMKGRRLAKAQIIPESNRNHFVIIVKSLKHRIANHKKIIQNCFEIHQQQKINH